jgi:hypothetical protein
MTRSEKLPISPRAAIQRINRKLATMDSRRLKTYRGGKWESDLGKYYLVDVERSAIVRGHVDLEAFAKELEVLAGYERVEEPEEAAFTGGFAVISPERRKAMRPVSAGKEKRGKKG